MVELKDIPENPGVYMMKNSSGKIIYVGKAKNLKKRVSSYFNRTNLETKTIELVKNIEDIGFFITLNEIEALILENNLIKKYKPKYNILLKDEKTYPYIRISKEAFPKIEVVRNTAKVEKESSDFFGPYPMGIYYFIKIIKRIFPLRSCNRDMEKVYDKPCLKYYMKYCMGPCKYKEIIEEYTKVVGELRKLLSGNGKELIKSLKEKMEYHSERMEYEEAIKYRSRIKEIENILQKQFSEYGTNIDEDVFVFKEAYDKIFILILNIRDGKVIEKNFVPSVNKEYISEDVFEDIFTSYYNDRPAPKNIIIDKEFREHNDSITLWLDTKNKRKHELFFPEIQSRRKELLELAKVNLEQEIDRYSIKQNLTAKGLETLKIKLGLRRFPYRIECFDISNIQGKDAVASMSVAINGKAAKQEYRKFKIRTKSTPDDFAMMEEVLYRRYSKLTKEELPEVLLVDGGKGQLGVAEKVLEKLGKIYDLDIISIAKKEELIFKAGYDEPFIFSHSDEALKILQRLRDEAHRFGITYHRKLRSKRVLVSELDSINGIGEVRKKKLLKGFGSWEKIKEATVEELAEYVPLKIAVEIKNTK